MISTNIDLTENRDFSSHHVQWLIQSMDNLSVKEKIFGRNRHESIDLFRKSDDAWADEMRTHCQRCGKELRIPWKRNKGVCEECYSILERDYRGSVFPWRRTVEGNTENSRNNPNEIFNLR